MSLWYIRQVLKPSLTPTNPLQEHSLSQELEASLRVMHPTVAEGVDDMINLGEVTEAGLLRNLMLRHKQGIIYVRKRKTFKSPLCPCIQNRNVLYRTHKKPFSLLQTYIGSVLVSVNPYQDFPIYTSEQVRLVYLFNSCIIRLRVVLHQLICLSASFR